MNTYFTLFFVLVSQLVYGQCFIDRHNTSSSSNWISCDKTASLNPSRGDSYWISYDFGELKTIKDVHFWNINNPDNLDEGARQIAIDYSADGESWSFWGIWEVAQGSESGFYEGEPGPSFDDLVTRHLLLTVIDNYGGSCSGFGEIRIGVEDYLSSSDELLALNQSLQVYPNPATEYTNLKMSNTYAGPATVELLDITGRVVQSQDLELLNGQQELRYDLGVAVSGQYVLRIITLDSEFSTELTITKTK